MLRDTGTVRDVFSLALNVAVVVPVGRRLDVFNSGAGAGSLLIEEPRGSSVNFSVLPHAYLCVPGGFTVTPGTSAFRGAYLAPEDRPIWEGATGATSLQGGTWVVEIQDGAGNALDVTYLGVGTAPATGVWHVALKATTAGTAPTINANAVFVGVIATDIVAGTVYPVAYPVKQGTAYAVGGATVADGTVSPS